MPVSPFPIHSQMWALLADHLEGPDLCGRDLSVSPHFSVLPLCWFQTVITAYPPDLDVIDGRIPNSKESPICLTPAFPVSPETPYGKKGEKYLGVTRYLKAVGSNVSFVVLFSPVKTSPRYPPFSPPEPQLSIPASLHKGRGKTPWL